MSPLSRLHPVSALCLLLAATVSWAEPPEDAADEAEPGAIVVDFRDGTTEAEFDAWEADWGVDVEFNSVEGQRTGITLARGVEDVEGALERIRRHPAVEAAEPLALFTVPEPAEASALAGPAPRASGKGFIPNDPDFGRQWNLALIDMPAAWERSRGKGVVVAVLDTGIAYEDRGDFKQVPDLKSARFVEGYDFVNDDAHANDDHGHGTHVAGTIAQATNNGEGVAGVAFEASLMPVKVLNHFGAGNAADIAEAIRFAADHGAQVINMSLGGGMRSEVMARAVAYAREKGTVVVAAAGNRGVGRVEYPAAYDGAVAVAAVGPDGARAPYSSYGKELDIAAPGGNKKLGGEAGGILQNTIDPRDPSRSIYASYQGTSMATPHVAAVAALLFAEGARGPEEVERALFEGATPVNGQAWSSEYGHGLLHADRTLAAMKGQWSVDWNPLVWAAVLLAAVLLTIGRRERPGYLQVLVRPLFLVPLLVATVGLFFVRWVGTHEVLETASLPLPDLERIIFGRGRPASPFVYSALIPVVASFVAIGLKGLRPVVGGLAIGFAGLLAYAAWSGAPAIAWMPFRMLAVPWLVFNVLVCLFVARALLRVERP
ncbi:MAG: S8 family serine peptidase [Myxococcaceae bacterium]|nr:S8 family serine peptidase [Myxococcaceae bacterium]MCI0672889.1 S8 family serine peptidase [Myxococcaceae bacterium]